MSIYFLFEDPSLKWRKAKKDLPKKECDILAVPPLKRLNQKKLEILRDRLDKNALYLSPSASLDALFPFPRDAVRSFFYLSLAGSLDPLSAALGFSSVCLFDAGEKSALFFLSAFTSLFLSGENAGEVSESILESTGAAVPVASSPVCGAATVFFKEADPAFPGIAFHPDFSCGGEKFGSGSLSYAPKGRYAFIKERLGRPLSCCEAARLYHYDEKATFNILTNPGFRSII